MAEPEVEREWICRARRGDPEAFDALVARHQKMIHALAYRMTGSFADADDIVQETFIRAYRELPGFAGEARFSSWLYRVAINRCLDWLKARSRRDRLGEEWRRETGASTVQPTAEPPALSADVQAALLKLKPKQRAAIVLIVCDGLSHAEAARVLHCGEATVSWRVFAARRRLKRLLQRQRPPN